MANIVAIVGRPNVGKSTLFNRLVERREAIMDDESGVTRDRHYGFAEWIGKGFTAIDTGGYVHGSEDVFEEAIRNQVMMALKEATVIIFMGDCLDGLTDLDKDFANVVRTVNKPVVVVGNKADTNEKMQNAVDHLRHEFSVLRTGRASTGLLESIKVNYYGSMTPLNQVANINIPEARLIVIQPWEKPLLSAIEKAILKSDLGLNPINDGQMIRVPIPAMTDERRQQLVKIIHKITEDARISVRNARRDANDNIKKAEKAHDVSEDNAADGIGEIQDMTKKYISSLDELMGRKEKEILDE